MILRLASAAAHGTALRARAATAVLAAALGACASTPPEPPVATGVERWSGRFSATVTYDPAALRPQSPEGGPPPSVERLAGRFRLSSAAGTSELELATPLGQTLARARADPAGATATTSDGRSYSADTAEALTEQVFRIRLPVGRLAKWLGGRLAGEPTATATVHGLPRPVRATEDDWDLQFDDWRATHPGRLTIDWPAGDRPRTPSPTIRRLNVRLVVDSHETAR